MYAVQCKCGAVRPVSATDAGGRVACACGREVVVPSLSALKASAGQSAMSAEVRIEQLLARGLLPEGTTCLVCRRATNDVAHCWTVCERERQVQAAGWKVGYLGLVFGVLSFWKERDRTEGRDVRFRLPLRVCRDCTDQLREAGVLKTALLEVPVYAGLLDKYPDADLSLDVGLAGLTRHEREPGP